MTVMLILGLVVTLLAFITTFINSLTTDDKGQYLVLVYLASGHLFIAIVLGLALGNQ